MVVNRPVMMRHCLLASGRSRPSVIRRMNSCELNCVELVDGSLFECFASERVVYICFLLFYCGSGFRSIRGHKRLVVLTGSLLFFLLDFRLFYMF